MSEDTGLRTGVYICHCGVNIAGKVDVETKEKIFDLFFFSKQVKGKGFGLFIARNIIAQHRGTITVDSIKRRGTTFTVFLPLTD